MDPYQQGIRAAHEGKDIGDNPYSPDHEFDEYVNWEAGWFYGLF